MKQTIFLCRRIVELKFALRLTADEMAYLIYLVDDLIPVRSLVLLFIY